MKHLLYILLMLPVLSFSQVKISGMIMEANEKNEHIGLAGANVYWLDTTIGTVTDIDGKFTSDSNRAFDESLKQRGGGGIRDMVSAHACMEAGADKLCLTTSAMDSPKLIAELAHRFGSQAIVVGIDVAYDETGTARLFDHRSGRIITNLDLWKYVEHVVKLGAGEIRLMAVDREGTLLGYDMSLFARIKELVDIPIILEGGAGSLHHLQEAFEAGVDGIASGAMLVFSDANLVKIKKHMITNRCNIRD